METPTPHYAANMYNKPRPNTQITPTASLPIEYLQNNDYKNIKRHTHKLWYPLKKESQSGPAGKPRVTDGKKPQNMMIVNNPKKPGPSGDARGERESSTPESQDPTDGSYIIDTESCNIITQ